MVSLTLARPDLLAAASSLIPAPSVEMPVAALVGGYLDAPPAPQETVLTSLEADLSNAIDEQRQKLGLPLVLADDRLARVARARSQDMAARGYFSHTTPEGGGVAALLEAGGIRHRGAAELLGETNGPDRQAAGLVLRALMDSRDHRVNLLSEGYTRIGVGAARDPNGTKVYTILLVRN